MSDTLVKVEGVSKKFCRSLKKSLWYGIQDLGTELLGRRHGAKRELRPDEFWSVKDVSFELKRGECLGLIGPNGAGKSTLLKMLNGLIKPDQGSITMRGRTGALIELGAGFNPILTGRENIYVNGTVLGLTKAEITREFDQIIDFAELGDFIDTPVQNYSSGMKVRLGFAVAAQLHPDVLLIDEVLAVGDVGFRAKCYNYISEINRNASVIYVSHNMSGVGRICSRAIVLNSANVIFNGNTSQGIQAYNSLFQHEKPVIAGSGRAQIHSLEFRNLKGELVDDLEYGESLETVISISVSSEIRFPVVFLGFHDQEMRCVAEVNSRNNGMQIENIRGEIKIGIVVDQLILNPGEYRVSCCIYDERMQEHCAWHFGAWTLRVRGNFIGMNPVQFNGSWTVEN